MIRVRWGEKNLGQRSHMNTVLSNKNILTKIIIWSDGEKQMKKGESKEDWEQMFKAIARKWGEKALSRAKKKRNFTQVKEAIIYNR